jgi:hypothetical protein
VARGPGNGKPEGAGQIDKKIKEGKPCRFVQSSRLTSGLDTSGNDPKSISKALSMALG